jgi:hypothetical protein
MSTTNEAAPKETLIHAAIYKPRGRRVYLLLRQDSSGNYRWHEVQEDSGEIEKPVSGQSLSEAMQNAYKAWRLNSFLPLQCGFRFTLPERDEIGRPAFFHEMIASYRSMTGGYFEPAANVMCIVQKASKEALDLWKRLEKENRL